ncbi:MAG: molecular chaperone DnaJ [Longispora sp.]|nr:molecular chaperone DnaJ [Longispora sp. (in: high G+C Gram-positive bacteria)]
MSSKDWLEKDFYAVLGVSKSASSDEIKKAYRKLARELHPDRNPDKEAGERFKALSEAYDVLSDDAKRKEYDELRSLFGSGAFRSGAGQDPRVRQQDFNFSSGGSFGDLFSNLFSGGAGSRRRMGPVRGRDVEAELVLDFDSAAMGAQLPLTLRSPGTCDTCHGSGATPGTTPVTCPLCAGRGLVTRAEGAFSLSEPCRNCQGVGTVVEHPCLECGGSGGVTKSRTLNVRIPPGVANGQKIRLKERGEPGERGGPPGDLYVLIKVQPGSLFGRTGDDLTLTVPVTFPEAVLGAELRVPTLDGSVIVRLPPGTPSGRTLRVRGKGIGRKDGKAGDLLVTIEVVVPTDVSEDARKALKELTDALPPANRSKIDAEVRRRESS